MHLELDLLNKKCVASGVGEMGEIPDVLIQIRNIKNQL